MTPPASPYALRRFLPLLLCGLSCLPMVKAAPFIWIEGESAKTTSKTSTTDQSRPQFLSGGKWLLVGVDEAAVEKEVPDTGILLDYAVPCQTPGRYEIWNRLGFEFARSPFEWRIDERPWQKSSPDDLTTDLMEMGFFCEVAWLKMGMEDLTAGDHHLQIRLAKTKDDKGRWQRLLYASDALCLSAEPFLPHSKFKPSESGRTPEDEAAAKQVFTLPAAKPSERTSVKLGGTWEIARDDEQQPGEVAEPIKALPTHPIWHAIQVPGDKGTLRPELLFAHRVWYRTRVEVPASLAGRAFFLEFPSNNLNTTVFVNGVPCGFEKNPFASFQVDISHALKPGQPNEICVGIRDAWYGRSADPARPMKLRRTFNLPVKMFGDGFQDLDYPVWNCPQSGILATPSLVAAGGAVWTTDVFVKPGVAAKRLDVEATVSNTTAAASRFEIHWEALDDTTNAVVHTFAPQPVELPAGQTRTIALSGPWSDPKLWWPDEPNLYRLRTTLVADGKPVDVKETPFGFREWGRQGRQFTLNGVVWHIWADLMGGEPHTPQEWLETYRRTGQRTMRFATAGQGPRDGRWMGLEAADALAFFDRSGVLVRRNATLDGEAIGYQFTEQDPETKRQQGGSELKLKLMKNWRDQCLALVRGERNHPSIQIWSMENEFAYINLINLLGNSPNMDAYEEEIKRTHDAVLALDPTRPAMTDGGGALKGNTLGVAGDHYVATLDSRYPDLAYEPFPEGGGRGRWTWDQKRPRYIGEDFYATGINPADYAEWGGEAAFQGKAGTRGAVARCYRMLMEGYRWGGHYAGWQFWLGDEGGSSQRGANAPRAVLTREWNWTFGSGQKIARTFGVFNDTQHPGPLTFSRRLTLAGKEISNKTTIHTVAPGTAEKFPEDFTMPTVNTRVEGELTLSLSAEGKEIHRDTKAVSLLPPATAVKLAGPLAVYDPAGHAAAFLKSINQPFTAVASLDAVPPATKVLLVGSDAISESDSTSTRLSILASEGRGIVVLDQSHPLKYQAIPAGMDLAPRTKKNEFGMTVPVSEGRTAFIEDAAHPALRGLLDKDFFTWGTGRLVYRNAYLKPARGGKSLLQCGPRLEFTSLAEVPVGTGEMLLCQLDVGGQLETNAVARQLVLNLIRSAAAYKLEFANVSAVIGNEQLGKALDGIGLQYAPASDPLAAISDVHRSIALVSATPPNLAALASHADALQAFWKRGGTLMLCDLTPDGLADYNRIVGVEHVIRHFKRERITFPAVKNPLTAGLTTGDIVMLSGKRMFDWNADEYVADDAFNYIVDLDDIAPFAKSDFGSYDNIVNGFVGADGWPLIADFPLPADGKPFEMHIDLPHEEAILEYTHDPSVNYRPTTKIALEFDGKNHSEFTLPPTGDPQTFTFDPAPSARRVTLKIIDSLPVPGKGALAGIDNINLKVRRSPEWHAMVRPMLNSGGLVQYAKGDGGVILCDLNFQETEAVPANKAKKRAILATILRNLKAPFAGGRTIIAGANLAMSPIDIHTKATTYKDERGWFGDPGHTFKALPPGEHVFGAVKYSVYEMPTSPVPQVLMLGGPNLPGNLPADITGIPVNLKADALFFLHTARIDKPMTDQEKDKKQRFELCKYVIHYADGRTEEVPILSETDIGHFQQKAPQPLPGAQLAWTARFENSEDSAALYSKQWNNPHPETAITSIDLTYGKDKDRGVPALIAITAASAK